MGTTTLPAPNDVIAFGDQVRRTPEVEVGKRLSKVGHEGLDVVAATTRLVKRILQQHVRRCEFIHDIQVAGLAPKVRKPATHDGLVLTFLRHVANSYVLSSVRVDALETGSGPA